MAFFALADSTVITIVFSILAAVPGFMTSLATLAQSRKNSVGMNNVSNKLEENAFTTKNIEKKANVIHELTNGKLSEIRLELLESREQLRAKDEVILKLTEKVQELTDQITKLTPKENKQ